MAVLSCLNFLVDVLLHLLLFRIGLHESFQYFFGHFSLVLFLFKRITRFIQVIRCGIQLRQTGFLWDELGLIDRLLGLELCLLFLSVLELNIELDKSEGSGFVCFEVVLMICGRLHDVPSTAELSMPVLLLLNRGGRLLLRMKLDLNAVPRQL